MVNPDSVVICALLGGGSALLGRLAFRDTAEVSALVEKIDMPLARKMCSLARGEFSERVWVETCTAKSMWYMIRQARLLAKIVIEIHKSNPSMIGDEEDLALPLRPLIKAIRYAGWRSLLELWGGRPTFAHARKFCKLFAQTYYIAENMIICNGIM